MQDEKIIVEYTSVALNGNDWLTLIEEGKTACQRHGFEFGVQIHNTATEEQIEKIAALGLKMSFHAPIVSDCQINLAAGDCQLSMDALENTAAFMRKYNVKKAVFHGFNMTDKTIPSFGRGRSYMEAFASIHRDELSLPGSSMCNNFFDSEEYKMRQARVLERLAEIRRKYQDLTFLLENDFPCFGAGSIFAEHIAGMNNPICLDSSHLWASAFVFDRDFHDEARNFLKSGLVQMVHLHASPYTSDIPKEKWSDGHLPLNIKNSMDLPRFIRLCAEYHATHFIFEINGVSKNDIDYLAENLSGARLREKENS